MNTGNYIQLSGRLTADVTPNEGKTFARFTLAKNFSKDNKDARFFRCVIFKKEFDDNQQVVPWDLLKKGHSAQADNRYESRRQVKHDIPKGKPATGGTVDSLWLISHLPEVTP